MKRINQKFVTLFFLCSILSVHILKAKSIDSLKIELNAAQKPGDKIAALIRLADQYGREENKVDAVKYYREAIYYAYSLKEYKEVARAYQRQGNMFRSLGEVSRAMESYLHSLSISDSIGDSHRKLIVMEYVGVLYDQQGDFKNAKKYYYDGYEMAIKLKDTMSIANMASDIATILERENKYDEALKMYDIVINYFKNFDDSSYLANSYTNIGLLYKHRGDLNTALKYFSNGLRISLKYSDNEGIGTQYNNIACTYAVLKRYKEAKENFDSCIAYCQKERSLNFVLIENYKNMAAMYEEKGEYNTANIYLKKYFALQDSVNMDERNSRIADLNTKYQTVQKEREIETLQLSNKQKTFVQYVLVVGCLFILIIAFLFYQRFQIKKKANLDLQKAYADLKNAQSHIVQSEKMASLGQLTAGIAHEINNPVNFISANILPLKRDVDDVLSIVAAYSEIKSAETAPIEKMKADMDFDYTKKEIHELLDGILSGANRTTEIVKGLRNFARTDEVEMRNYSVKECLDSTLLLMANQLGERISTDTHFGNIPPIDCFPGKLNQAFMNIITNSIQAIENKGTITITTGKIAELKGFAQADKNSNSIFISIKDTGCGMDAETQKHIFEPFFTTKKVGAGAGLGLSIAYGIIEEHKGQVLVDSVVEKGTEVVIVLPIGQA